MRASGFAGRIRAGALFAWLVMPAHESTALAAAPDVRVNVARRGDDLFSIDGRFDVNASTANAWAVITDYAGIPSFVSSMKASRIIGSRSDGTLLVEQTAVGHMFLVSKQLHVTLEIRHGAGFLSFNDFGHVDFWIYSGSWKVQSCPDGVEVRYRLLAQPDFAAPGFLLGGAMRRGSRDLLEQVRAEIIRRTASSKPPTAQAAGRGH
jgi:hypothetical protein